MNGYKTLKQLRSFQQNVENQVRHVFIKKPLRAMFQWINDNYKVGSGYVGVEIGVWMGENARSVLENMDMSLLYLIDPYKANYDKSHDFVLNEESFADAKEAALGNVREYADRVICLFDVSSDDAVDLIPDAVDFIYIDGDHSYKQVKKDVANYFGKVKEGGVFGGDDYTFNYPSVIWAVEEFVVEHDLKLFHLNGDWWVVKS